MNQARPVRVSVRIVKPAVESAEWQARFLELNVPPRSRLYGLEPCGMETVWGESLTSYINRLGWRHGVDPRTFAVQEIGPFLDAEWWHYPSPSLMGVFCSANAMSLNGSGNLATIWLTILEQLTMRTDLPFLTAPWWIGDLPTARNFRASPAWCPACYDEWKKRGLPIYQPLLWMLQVITICPIHKMHLKERCASCQGKQAVISSHKAHPGECTKCASWLGSEAHTLSELPLDDGLIRWQEWSVSVLKEFQALNLVSGVHRWDTFFTHLANYLDRKKGYSRLALLTGIDRRILYRWVSGAATPSLEMILKFCYICNTTPMQIMSSQFASLEQTILGEVSIHPRRHRPAPRQHVDREYCHEFIQAILDGREQPLGPCQVAKRLGCQPESLKRWFPQEYVLLAQMAQTYRKQQDVQRIAYLREKIRQEVMALHAQGVPPTHRRLRKIFPPGIMHHPEANAAWRDALRELGLRS